MERKLFWLIFGVLSLATDFFLPLWWGLFATIPIGALTWWLVYRSGWLGF